jgi:hypothetical protein
MPNRRSCNIPSPGGILICMVERPASSQGDAPGQAERLREEGPIVGFSASDTSLVITDPQNDFLSPTGATWGLVGANVEENDTVANIERLFQAPKP